LIFEVKILGCNSASFAFGRHHTSQVVNSNQNLFLVDCGEGTQLRMIKQQIRFNRIHHIFISHLHGDHYLGLMGLIFTFHLQGRTDDLYIYGPPGLDEIISLQLRHSESVLHYRIHFQVIEHDDQLLFENEDLQIISLAMNHRIACYGFVFREKQRRFKLKRELLPETLGREELLLLKEGQNVTDSAGRVWRNEELASPPPVPRTYIYAADTRVLDGIREVAEGCNLLYHEATFTSEMQSRAEATFHSTAAEAAQFAARHHVERLILGHFSSRYQDVSPVLAEAIQYFPHTILAAEGQTYEVPARVASKQHASII
jgi:ribonuclease Z